MDLHKLHTSKKFLHVIVFVGITAATLFIFAAGVAVGYHKASFRFHWGENYHRNFGGPRAGFLAPFDRKLRDNPHGAFGEIIKIEFPMIAIKGPGENEKAVRLGTTTSIRRFNEEILPSDLKLDDFLVIIGEPTEDGVIEARFIRVMPPQQEIMMGKRTMIQL